jgi:hypothetical protein
MDDERGVVAVIVALLMVVLMGSAAMTFDLARLRHERHLVQAAVDLGSLAGAGFLPVNDATGANAALAAARAVAIQNAPELASAGLSIDFACVVAAPVSQSFTLGFACGPGGNGVWTGGWTVRAGKAIHSCNPFGGDLCNTIRASASSTVDYWFAPFIGFDQGSTGAVRAAACRGFCGQSSSPLDVVFVIDRTASMSTSDIANLKDAIVDTSAAEDSVLEFYNPADVRIGLVALPYRDAGGCGVNSTQNYPAPVPPAANQNLWQVVGLSNDYRLSNGNVNPSSLLVQRIQCLQRAGSPTVRVNGRTDSHGHTDHGDPLMAAVALLNQGRPEAPDVIIFFADGESNQPYGVTSPCSYAINAVAAAKAAGTSVFALGYGAEGARCQYDSGAWANAWATRFLSTVASPTSAGPSTDNAPGGCASNENTDGDYYFCESRGEDLDAVFRQIAVQSIQKSRLLNF